ncbi:MAG: hypothetical protein ACKVU0_18010 [Saprospiraceae bacterium]
MKKTTAITLIFFATASYFLYVGCGQGAPDASKSAAPNVMASMPSRLPQDVMQSCTLSQTEFQSWFVGGNPTTNGIVVPANSVTFGHNNNCDFYKWSWQMFAWLVSPISATEIVMSSPTFYTVSPVDGNGNRNLIQHTPGQALRATSNITQAGPNGLPTILGKDGKLHEVEKPAAPGVKPMLLNGTQKTAVSSVEIDASGKPIFKDKSGKVIANPKSLTQAKGNVVQAFTANNGQTVLLGANGVVESEEGQAGGNHGLLAQNGSIVYYISMVNDVFAVYLSAAKNNYMSGLQFPTTAAQMDSIIAIALAMNIDLPDPNALAIEIKTSWVEASTLPDVSNYVTINAIIPTYDKSNPKQWVPNGEQTVKLALLGAHVVGSTAGHPEMVWATFEHLQNSPFAAYQYLNNKNVVDTVPQETQGKWTLNGNPTDPEPNHFTFSASGNTLTGNIFKDPNDPNKTDTLKITAVNTTLVFPWGSEMGVSPNAEDGSSAASNSEVISINQSVFGWLVGNDIRKNYLLIGATWTSGGVAPSGNNFSTNPTDPGAAIGTSLLANSTMETFKQTNQNSCFGCHSNTNSLMPGDLSHIYDAIQPLPIPKPNFKGLPVK